VIGCRRTAGQGARRDAVRFYRRSTATRLRFDLGGMYYQSMKGCTMTTVDAIRTNEATDEHRSTARGLNREPQRGPGRHTREPDGGPSTDGDQFDPRHRISRLRDIWS
jgi:hypothetical protein